MRKDLLHSYLLFAFFLGAWGCSDADQGPAPDGGRRDGSVAFDAPLAEARLPDQAAIEDTGSTADNEILDSTVSDDSQSCLPVQPVSSLPHFTALEADLAATSDPAARAALIDAFLAAMAQAGGAPARDGSMVIFFFRGPVSASLSVAGTFNGWQAGVDVLLPLAGTDLYYLKKNLGGQRQEYKLVNGGVWFKDPLNRNITWDGIAKEGPGDFNSVLLPWGSVNPTGRVEWLTVPSPQLGHTRDIFVYLPAAHDLEPCRPLPLLLVNDGNESLTRSHFDQVAADLVSQNKAGPAILGFVALAEGSDRMSEYSCEKSSQGPLYTAFLCDTLVPLIDERYHTSGTADGRGIIGASMGGLIAYAALFWRNDCLHFAGAQSGSFWFADEEMVKRVESTTPKVTLLSAYLDNGTDNLVSTHHMRDALAAQGYPVHHVEDLTQEHTWSAWMERFGAAYSYIFPPDGLSKTAHHVIIPAHARFVLCILLPFPDQLGIRPSGTGPGSAPEAGRGVHQPPGRGALS